MCLLVQGCKAQIYTRDGTCETALSCQGLSEEMSTNRWGCNRFAVLILESI
jgi:hypothetical protein